MAAAMHHRGPDDVGVHVDGPVGFAFRRLAILDLSTEGHQPMLSADGRHALVYNGEIYNYQDVRERLEKEGPRLRGIPTLPARAEGHRSHDRAPRNGAIRYEKVGLNAVRRGTTFLARHSILGQRPERNQ
jgi:hypothetical protein